MPEYLHPGVYVEEQPAPQTIEGVSTSTAGFVGATKKGPTSGLPQLVTSFPDFARKYGDYLPQDPWGDSRFLAYAVQAFFDNGGQRAYIKRVVGDGALAASLTLNDGFVARLAVDTASAASARTTARLTTLRGIEVGSTLSFREVIDGTAQSEDRTVTAYNSANNIVTLDTALGFRFTAAGCTVVLSGVADAPEPSAGTPSLRVTASSEGIWGRDIQVLVSDARAASGLTRATSIDAETALRAIDLAFDSSGPGIGDTTVTLADTSQLQDDDVVEFDDGSGNTEERTVTVSGNDISWSDGLVHDYSGGGSSIQRLTAVRAGAANPVVPVDDANGFSDNDLVRLSHGTNTQIVQIAAGGVDTGNNEITLDTATYAVATAYEAGDPMVLANAGSSGSTQLNLRSVRNFYANAVVEIDDGAQKAYHTVESIAGNGLVLASPLASDVPDGSSVRVVEFNLSVTDTVGGTSELFENLSMDSDADNYVETVVNPSSQLVQVTALGSTRAVPFNVPSTDDGAADSLTGGDDGDVPGADDYIGEDNGPGQRTGIKSLVDIDQISIIAAPGISDPSVHGELISQCEQLKYRFAVLDPAVGSVIGSGQANDIIVQRNSQASLYAAIYYPWLQILDPLYPNSRSGSLVPPSGHVIGIYARVDNERGVHKAPANETVRGIRGVEVKISDREQDILNPLNINVIRDFTGSGRGFRVWGARCVTTDNAWKYIPVRRLFIFLEKSMDEGLKWVVFEPNGEDLWARVRQTLNGFLRTIWLSGALAGVTEEEAFFVRCDRTTMTEDDIANGRLIVVVGVAPLRPAEFVIIRIGQKTLEATS